MKQSKRILAYSALALVVMLAAFGAIAFDTSNVAYAQGTGTVPAAPTLTANASGANSIQLTWNAVDDAENYELWAWDSVDQWQRLDGGESDPLTGLSFTHSELSDGRTYYYQIRAINADGGMSAWSARVNEVAGNAPARPELTTTAGYEQITVSWPPVTDAARYEIYAWDGAWAQLDGGAADPLSATTYTQTGLTAGRTIYYQARAVNAGGVMSAWSAQVNAVVLSTSTVSAPQTLTASDGNGQVALNWAAPANNSGLGVDGYHYRYGETGGTMGEWTGAGDVLTVTISGLTNSTGYTFEVRAYNSGGNGPAATVSATPLDAPSVPGTPGSLRAAPISDRVTLTWTAPADNGAAISGYQYQSYETSGTAPSTWNNAGNVLSVVVSNLTKGTSYTFNVRAMNSVGPGATATATATPSSKPSMPQNLRATGGNGVITLSWEAPADSGGSAIVNYRIEKYNATSTNWGPLTTVSGTTYQYPDNNVTIGATTEYRVRAMNANTSDPSLWATVSGVAQGKGVPGEPDELKATPGNERISYTWKAPVSNGGATITKYEYRHWVDGGTVPTEWTNHSRGTSITFQNLTATSQHRFRVRAVNEVGAGAPAESDGVYASTSPDPPRRFEADSHNRNPRIDLTWRDPDDDGGAAITGFVLDVTPKDDPDEEDWETVTTYTSSPSADSHDHVGLTNGVTYYYRVRATNARCLAGVMLVEGEDNCRQWSYANATTVSSWPAEVGALDGTTDDVSAEFDDGRITVTWEAPLDHGEPITSYRLRWRHGADEPPNDFPAANVVSVVAPATEYIMIGPEVAINYVFQVLAVNSLTDFEEVDNSFDQGGTDLPITWSDSSSPIPVLAVALQPISGDDELSVDVADDGRATISWRMVEDTNYTISSYDVQWVVVEGTSLPDLDADMSGDFDVWDDADPIENLAAQALMSRITDPLPGATNVFARVRVVTTVGTKSAWATTDNEPVEARAPDNPVLEATIIGQNVLLSWKTPENNGACITHYELQFKKDDGDFGDHDGDDDATGDDGTVDPDSPDNDVIEIVGDCTNNAEVLPDTSYSHEELAANSTYAYRIRTVTEQNNEVTGAARTWSAEAVAQSDPGPTPDPVVPGTPTLRAMADNTDGHITLEWDPPAVKGTEPITSYQLQRWDGSAWEGLPASLDAMDEDYNDETAELGKMYYYAIRAVSSAGMGEWTQRVFPDAMLNAKAPAKIDLSLSVDGQAITLSWTTPEDNGNAITAYQIQVTATAPDDGNRQWGGTQVGNTISPSPALSTSYTHSGLVPGRTYYFRIRSVNACNDTDADTAICGADDANVPIADAEDWSDEEDETTAPIAPSAPGADTSAFGGGARDALVATGGDAEVALTWELPGPDDDFTDDMHEGVGGAHITSVEIQRWNGATAQWDDIKTVEVGFQDDEADPLLYTSASQMYPDTGLADGATYTYRVRAVNSAGDSPWSNMAMDATDAARPALPKLDATVSGQSVTLTWNTPDNNGSPIQRYEIQRFPSIGLDAGTAGEIDADDVENDWGDDSLGTGGVDQDVIVPMPAGVTTHTDSGLSPSTLYYYRMRAVNGCNDTDATDTECPGPEGNGDAAVEVPGATWSAVVQVTTDPRAPARIPRNTSADDQPINGLKLTGGENKVTLEWTDPEAYGAPISEYQIDRWDSGDRMWVPVKRELPASVRMYEDTGLETGARYFYRVRAVNAGGEGAWSTLTSAETDPAPEDE